MSEKTELAKPANIPLPYAYKDTLDYRQPQLIKNSTDTSDNKDKRNSGETSPINNPTPKLPIDQYTFKKLDSLIKMATQSTGTNTQQIG